MKTLLYKACPFIIFIGCSLTAIAQQFSIDSLKKVLRTQKQDTARVNTMCTLGWREAIEGDFKSAFKYAETASNLAKKNSFKKGEGNAYWSFALIYEFEQRYDSAIANYFSALKIYEQLNDKPNTAYLFEGIAQIYDSRANDPKTIVYSNKALRLYEELKDTVGIASCYLNIATYYRNINGPEAVVNYYKAIKLYKGLNYKKITASCFQNIGFVYYYQENYKEALDAFSDALKLNKATGDSNGISQCYIYISKIYNTQKNYTEALNYSSVALKIAISANDVTSKAGAYYAMGDILYQQAQNISGINVNQLKVFSKASDNYIEALKNFKDRFDSGGMGDCYGQLADVNIKLHQFLKAQKYADSALAFAQQVTFSDNFEKSYLVQEELDSIQGNYKNAYSHYKLYIAYRDSIFNEKNAKKLVQTQMQYDFDKKEAVAKAAQDKKDADEKRIKNKQYFAIAALGIVVLAVVVIALIQFRNNKHKQKANLLLERQKQKVETTLLELKSTQSQLIQSEKMASLGELTAGIAHEIQNPLNFVNNFSEVNKELLIELKDEASKGNIDEVAAIANDVIDNEEKINHHGRRADAIVKGMLQHSRQSSGKKELTDLNALCDEYLRLSYHGLRAKDKNFNADFTTDFDESVAKINIVPQDIGRVLLNLFNNALYAVNERNKTADGNYKPLVSISTKKSNKKIEIRVEDNGNGIPSNIADKIFQPFFTTKPTGQGTGLGLSLAYDIITNEHGGKIKVESKVSEGATFIIQLPVT